MKVALISELKAKLSRYIRLVKGGEDIEIRERGIPVARLIPIRKETTLAVIPPRKDPGSLAKYRFSSKPKIKFDALELLLEDRSKR